MTKTKSKLTGRQEAFCRAYMETGNASEAYRRAFVTDKMAPHTIWRASSALKARPEVTARIAELEAAAAEAAVLNKAWVLNRLMRNAKVTMGEEKTRISYRPRNGDEATSVEMFRPNPDAANRALELLGREVGLFTEKLETTNTHMTVTDAAMTPEEWEAQNAESVTPKAH
jgi:phage terminase small subunit